MLRRVVKSSIRYMFCSRNNNDQYKDYDHVFVNQDKIKKKMEEIKRRKNQSGMQKPKISQLMPEIGSYKENSEVQKFRRDTQTSNLFVFEDENVKKQHYLNVDAYNQNMIEVDRVPHPPSLILYDSQALVWEVQTAANIRLEHFNILKILNPKPQYIIIAVKNPFDLKLKNSDFQKLREIADVDVLQLFQAIGTFNMSSQDEVKVIMFIISE